MLEVETAFTYSLKALSLSVIDAFCVIAYFLKAGLTLFLSDAWLSSFDALYFLDVYILYNVYFNIFVSGLSLLHLYVLSSIIIDFNWLPVLLIFYLTWPYIEDVFDDTLH